MFAFPPVAVRNVTMTDFSRWAAGLVRKMGGSFPAQVQRHHLLSFEIFI